MTCSNVFGIIVILYIITLCYHLYQSSIPLEPCSPKEQRINNNCLQPLLFANNDEILVSIKGEDDNDVTKNNNNTTPSTYTAKATTASVTSHLVLELRVPKFIIEHQPVHDTKKEKVRYQPVPKMEWVLVSSCQNHDDNDKQDVHHYNTRNETQMIFSDIFFTNNENDSNNKNNTNNSNNNNYRMIRKQCHLTLPDFSRIRTNNAKTMKIFKGKLTLKRIITEDKGQLLLKSKSQYEIILSETIVDFTRLIHNVKNQEYVPYYKYYKQALILRVVADSHEYSRHNPRRGDGFMMMKTKEEPTSNRNHENNNQYYYPLMYVDEVALRHSSQIELAPPPASSSQIPAKPPVNLTIKIIFISPLRDVIQRQLHVSIDMAEKILRPNEVDEMKYFLSDEYMYRFILTQIIGFIHLTLDYLAFKNEIGFYVGRGMKDVTGISLSSIYSRCICDIIIFLYLIDGGNTSWFVLFSIGISICVELWKLIKFLQPKFEKWNKITFRDLSQLTSTEKMTVDYDGIARAYLSLILYPLVLGLALYGRQFHTYTSWYSWMISNLANAVYTFGFIGLCPQLYINYRLKSVAHLPWRVFVYKIFNTFVDDVFAFLIEMPLKHKIMTLRDDIVFIIFLFQAYIYRVDKTRANEFGYVYEKVEGNLPSQEGGEIVDRKKNLEQKCETFDNGIVDKKVTKVE